MLNLSMKLNNILILFLLTVVLFSGGVYAVGTYLDVDISMSNYQHLNNNSAIGESQTKTVDSALKINNGTIIGNPIFNPTSGFLMDGAWEFDGSGDGIDMGNATNNINYNESYSISAWIKAKSYDYPTTVDIISKGIGTGYPFVIKFHSSDTIQFQVYDGTNNPQVISTTKYNDSVWHFVVATRNKTEGKIHMYVDGVQVGTGTTDTTAFNTVSNNLNVTIGKRTSGTADFNGSIDEFIVWNKTLSTTDITSLYNTYIGKKDCGDSLLLEYNTTGAKYYINPSNAQIICVKSTLTNTIITQNTSGYAIFDGTTWQIDSNGYRLGNSFYRGNTTEYNSTYFKFIDYGLRYGHKDINYTLIYDFSKDYLNINISNLYNSGEGSNLFDGRFVFNLNRSYLENNEYKIIPNGTSNFFYGKINMSEINNLGSDFSFSINSNKPNREWILIQKQNITFLENIFLGVLNHIPSGSDTLTVGNGLNHINFINTDINQTTISFRYMILNATYPNIDKNFFIRITNDTLKENTEIINNINYNESSTVRNMKGAWYQFGCGSEDSYDKTDSQLNLTMQKAYNNGTRFVQIHCWLPVYGNYTTVGSWIARGGGTTNVTELLNIINIIHQNGMKAFIYYSPTELDDSIALINPTLSPDIVQNSSGGNATGFISGSTVLYKMNYAPNSAWWNFTWDQQVKLLGNLSTSDGIFVDRMDYATADYGHFPTNHQVFWDSATSKAYTNTRENTFYYLKQTKNLTSSLNMTLVCNVPSSVSLMQWCDVGTGDWGNTNIISGNAIFLSSSKPYFYWGVSPANMTEDSVKNKLILWGLYPAYLENDLITNLNEIIRLINITSNENIEYWTGEEECSYYQNITACRINTTITKTDVFDWYDHTNRKIVGLQNNSVRLLYNGSLTIVLRHTNITKISYNGNGKQTVYNNLNEIIDNEMEQELFSTTLLKTLSFQNLTNFLAYNTNGSLLGNSNINLNDGEINITLPPNNSSYVLDNFNVTEGIPRENSPITLEVDLDTYNMKSYRIKSNITNNITVPLVLSVSSCDFRSVVLTPKNQSSYTPEYVCEGRTLIIQEANLSYSLDSNELLIVYDPCPGSTIPILELAVLFLALAVLLFSIGLAVINPTIKNLIIALIGIIIGSTFVVTTITIINTACS